MKTVYLIYSSHSAVVPQFPEGALAVAGALLKQGFRTNIIDLNVTPSPVVPFEDPLFFGFTVYSNRGIGPAVRLARRLRSSFPNTPMVWGGPHAQMVPEQTAAHPCVDAACYGEGEGVAVEIARAVTQGTLRWQDISGVAYRDPAGIIHRTPPAPLVDVDTLPYHPYELLDFSKYFVSTNKGYYQSSRGCPFCCSFCTKTQQGRWRGKSPELVLEHVTRMIGQFGIKELYFSDANLFVDIDRVRAIADGILRQRLGIGWSAFCRADSVARMSDETLRLLRASGCGRLSIGGESGSDRVLKLFSKGGVNRAVILQAVARLCGVGIRPELSFIVGAPMETDDDLGETISLVNTIRGQFPSAAINGMFHYQPYPDSTLGAQAIDEWKLPMPASLEEWERHAITLPRRKYFPWLDDRRYNRMITTSHIASYLYYYDRLFDSVEGASLDKSLKWRVLKTGLRAAHLTVIKRLIRLRWERGRMEFPLEWRAFGLIRDRVFETI